MGLAKSIYKEKKSQNCDFFFLFTGIVKPFGTTIPLFFLLFAFRTFFTSPLLFHKFIPEAGGLPLKPNAVVGRFTALGELSVPKAKGGGQIDQQRHQRSEAAVLQAMAKLVVF